ncbi:MAG: ribbon-helix-helix domain-containing protein [Bifidobacteriaceae bacterium]|nr:ribbon-helix-helix domain-containing protein [Bifidobacteriaceae bacterium]
MSQVDSDVWWSHARGEPITNDDIARLVANAEAGFLGAILRPVGRPLEIGRERAKVIQFRIDNDCLERFDSLAKRAGMSRSQLLRDAVDRALDAA